MFDAYVAQNAEAPQDRVALVLLTEEDVKTFQAWPVPDSTLARALEKILEAEPRVVGVDVYRDIRHGDGHNKLTRLLSEDRRLIGIEALRAGELTPAVSPPPVLVGTGRIGFNDLAIDSDSTVRRSLLYQDDGEDYRTSLSLRIAEKYLEMEGIVPEPDPAGTGWLKLGAAVLRPLEPGDGGYRDADAAGYQILPASCSRANAFKSYDFRAVMQGDFDTEVLRDRIVLVGAALDSVPDLFATPCSPDVGTRGVVVHANLANSLVSLALGDEDTLGCAPPWSEVAAIVLFALLGGIVGSSLRGVLPFAFVITLGLAALGGCWLLLMGRGIWFPIGAPGLAWAGAAVLGSAWRARAERLHRGQLMQLFSRHVSHDLAEEIWRRREEFTDGGRPRPQRMTASVLFLDMKGYSGSAEKMDPAVLLEWVNEFLRRMAEAVSQYGGIVDDYFGDGIKANFGVPFPHDDPAQIADDAISAVQCGIQMTEALDSLNASYRERNLPEIALRIGIDTGPIVFGELGETDRLKYTSVGDVPIVAQRLEGLSGDEHDFAERPYRILISRATRDLVGEHFTLVPLGEFAVKGKSLPVEVFRVEP